MNTLQSERGFTLVEILLVVLILVVVSFAGYYVWDRQQSKGNDTEKSTDTTKTIQNTRAKNSIEETARWFAYEPENKSYKIKLPDGWKFKYISTESMPNLLYAPNKDMEDTPNVKANVETSSDGFGLGTGFSLNVALKVESTGYGEGENQLKSFRTSQGQEVLSSWYEQPIDDFNMTYEPGAKIYTYRIFKEDKVYKFEYSLNPGDKDQRTTVEKSIKTIVLP